MEQNKTNKQVSEHLKEWIKETHGVFGWPTDGCGYNQHIKFVKHRNKNWDNYYLKHFEKYNGDVNKLFNDFVLEYANNLLCE